MENKQLDKYYAVGSDGFVALKETMGSDEDIEQAARISYGKGTRKRSKIRGLIRYLRRNRHTTPFEMAEMKFHVRVPMDAWRQWIRHRTANVNEYSTRYSEAIDVRATTDPDKWRLQSGSNKQGSDGYLRDWTPETAGVSKYHFEEMMASGGAGQTPGQWLSEQEEKLHNESQKIYQERLEFGIAREQARKDLPLSTYTEAFWKCDLHNIMHFLGLRCDSHAQLEIREYADVIAGLVKEVFPLSFEAWYDYVYGATGLSRLDRLVLEKYIDLNKLSVGPSRYLETTVEEQTENFAKDIGMSKREIGEFWNKIKPAPEKDFSLEGKPLYDISERM